MNVQVMNGSGLDLLGSVKSFMPSFELNSKSCLTPSCVLSISSESFFLLGVLTMLGRLS
jgi:hypothetical protein